MDILTQGLLGGVLAQSVAKKNETKIATLVGIVAGLLADADIFIYSSNDPLLNVEFHRHFTHSVFFIPFGAAIAAILFWPFLRKKLSFPRLYLFSFMGYSLSGVLDASTSYGTHLLWPLMDERFAFHIISIVDPVFSLILFTTLILSLRIKRRPVARFGLLFAALYMSLGYVQLQRAQQVAESLIASRGHIPLRHIVKPTLANLILWRSVYIYNDRIYVDAVRLGMFSKNKIYQGSSVKKFSLTKDMAGLNSSSVLYKDIKRFEAFSDGYIAMVSPEKNVIGDIRYSMLPDQTEPLWGIVINNKQPQVHADYKFFRDAGKNVRQKFIDMLFYSK